MPGWEGFYDGWKETVPEKKIIEITGLNTYDDGKEKTMKQTKFTAIIICLMIVTAILAGCAENQTAGDALSSIDESSQATEETTAVTGSQGLAYTVNSDNTSCTVTGMGSCQDTKIVIPSTIDGYDVTEIGSGAFQDCTSLTSIALPTGVVCIGENAFSGCTALSSVTIGNREALIGRGAFLGCSSLRDMTFPTA